MATDNEVDVDISVGSNELEASLRRTFELMQAGLQASQRMQTFIENTAARARELPGHIAGLTKELDAARKSGDQIKIGDLASKLEAATGNQKKFNDELRAEVRLQQELNLARGAGRRVADRAVLSDGRTAGEARATESALRDAVTGINTTAEQLSARLATATGKAMERLLTSTSQAIENSYLVAMQRQASRSAQISVPGYLDARVTNDRVAAELAVERAQQGGTLAERRARAARIAELEEQSRAADRKEREFQTLQQGYRNQEIRDRQRASARDADPNTAIRAERRDSTFFRRYGISYDDYTSQTEGMTTAERRVFLNRYVEQVQRNTAAGKDEETARRAATAALQQETRQAEDFRRRAALSTQRADYQNYDPRAAVTAFRSNAAFQRNFGISFDDYEGQTAGLDRKQRVAFLEEAQKRAMAARPGPGPAKTLEERARDSFEARNAQFSLNGGADQFKFQAQLAANYAMFGAITGAITGSVSAIREFDDTLARFQAITGAASAEMGPFREGLLGIAKDSRFSVNELAQVSIALGQTGLSVRGVLETLKPVADLAAASGSTLEQSVQAITGVLGAYGMAANRATEVSDILVGALNRTKLTMEQVQLGIQYAANIARDSGVSFTELAATIGAIAQAGVKSGSTIGTGLRQLLTEFSNPSEKLRGVLKELGISLQDIDLRANGLSGVLENLQKAGFTTADALRALDLRAANAFSAIAGQGQLIEKLRQEMLLSSAAAEAAGKANESFNATLQRLQNTTFALIDRAFGPLVTALRTSTDALATMVGGMDKLGATLPAIGVGLTAIVGTLALLKVGALAVGLLTTGAGGVALGVGAAAGIGYLLARLLDLEAALGRIEKRIDVLNGLENDLKSERDTVITANTDLDRQIEGLIARREKLNDNPLQLQNEIIQAQKSYGELGFSMEGVSKSADGLIAAYQRLREAMAAKLPDLGLQEILVTQQKLIALQEKQAEKAKLAQPYTAVSSADSVSIAEGFGFSGTPETRDPLAQFRSLGPAFDAAMNMVRDPGLIDAKDPLGSTQAVRAQMVAARQGFFNQLVAEQSKPVGQQDAEAIRRFKEQLDLSAEAMKRFSETAGDATAVQAENVKLERQLAQNRVDLIQTSPEVKAFERTLRTLEADRASDQGRVLGDKSLDGRQRLNALMGALEPTRDRARAELDRLNAYRDEQIAAGKNPVEVDTALSEIRGKLDQVAKNVTKEMRELVEAIKPEAVLVTQAERRANDAQIAALSRSAQLERDQDELRRIEERGRNLIEVNAALSRDILTFGKTPEQVANDTGIKDQLDQLNRETEAKLQRFSDDFVRRRQQLEDQALRLSANTEKAREADLRAEASRLEKIANDARTTPEKARELVEQINKLLDQAKEIATRRIDIETQREVTAAPSGPLPNYVSAPPGSVAAQIIEGARGAGRGDMANYLLGLGTLESSLNPRAANKSGAKGLFQFMNNEEPGGVNTWGKYGKGSIWEVQNQIAAVLDFTRDNDAMFRSRLGRDPTDAERFVLHNQGGPGGTRLLRNPNDLARNYVSAAAIENNGAKGRSGTITAGEFTDILKGMYADASRRAGGLTTDAKTVLGQRRDAEVSKVGESDEEARRRVNAIPGRKKDAATLAGLKLEDKTGTAQIAAALTKLANANEVSTVATGSGGITAGYGRLRARALQEDALDINNRSRTPEQKAAAEEEITERFRVLSERGAIAASEAAGRVAVRGMDQEIARVEARLKALQNDRNENKVDQSEVDAEAQRLNILKERRGLEGENEAIKAQILVLEKALTDAAAAGLGPAEKQVAINEKLVELKRRAALSDEQVGLKNTLDRTAPTMNNTISGAINDFEKGRGIRNPLGEIVRPTEEARKIIAAELQVVGNAFDNFFTNLFSGSMKAGDALKKFATDILGGLMSQISKSLTNDIFKAILGGGSGGGLSTLLGEMTGFSFFSGGPGMANGGPIRMAGGGAIPGLNASNDNRDSVDIKAMPGEYLLRKSAVDAIGRDTLDQVNSLGGQMVSRAPQVSPSTRFGGATASTSVYVVDRDQVPPPGPNEVVHFIGENIQRGGAIRQLIKQVQARG